MPVVEPDTGEYMILVKNKKVTDNINTGKFIKFYLPLIDILNLLSASDLQILKFICQNIKINKQTILITIENTKLNKTTFYRSINKLVKLNIIYKTQHQNIFKINKEMLYNGKY